MERFGRWVWERHATRFIPAVALADLTVLSMSLAGPCVVIGSLYLDLGRGEGALWFGVTVAVGVSATFVVFVRLRGSTRAIHRWAAGDESDPVGAWTALVRLPQQFAMGMLTTLLPANLLASLPVILALADTGAEGTIGLVYAYVMVTGAAAALTATTVQVLVRPAVAAVGAHIGAIVDRPPGPWSVRRRLVMTTFVVTSLAVAAGPLLVLGTTADDRDYVIALLGGGVLSAYVCWLLDIGLFQATVRPVGDLIDGTARVGRGELTTQVPVTSLDQLGDLAVAFNSMQAGLRERESLQAAFGSYVDPLLAQRLIRSGSSVFEGEELEVSVLFADVRDFTSYAEGVDPGTAVALLNDLFDVIVPVLHEHLGHANHYLGDGLLAVFGAPQPLDRHAEAAVAAASEIQRRVRATFGDALRLGIGINTGPVIAGTVGGGGRHEFTVIGDTVNVAARVEQLTKDTGDAILVTEATVRACCPPLRTTGRGRFDLRGKTNSVTLHAVDPFAGSAP